MNHRSATSENAIRGSCSCFACRCCLTKFGWEHQEWCEYRSLSEPSCKDCRYFNIGHSECAHPAMK